MTTSLTDALCRVCGGSTGLSVEDHVAQADPHTQYLLEVDATTTYEPLGEAASEVATHEADAGDPHSAAGYLQAADLSTYATEAYADAAVSTHAGLADPHPDYALESFAEDLAGWAYYQDDTVTSGSPLALVAATPADLPNAADTVNETQLPDDRTDFYETTGSTVTFPAVGELVEVQVDVTVEAVAATDWLDIWLEDSGAVEHGRSTFALPKGATAQRLSHRFAVRANAALVANGGTVRVESNDTADLYDIRFTLSRSHRPRTT